MGTKNQAGIAHDGAAPRELPIHFTFADNSMGYDCVRCGARCCKRDGGGFGLTGDELQTLEQQFGGVRQLAHPTRSTNYFAIHQAGDRCAFLEADESCRVHGVLGYQSKPFVCRLFPANQLYLLRAEGRDCALVVELNPICPVDVLPERYPLQYEPLRRDLLETWQTVLARATRIDFQLSAARLLELIAGEARVRDGEYPELDGAHAGQIETLLGQPLHLTVAAQRACALTWPRLRFFLWRQAAQKAALEQLPDHLDQLASRLLPFWVHLVASRCALARQRPTVQGAFDAGASDALPLYLLAQLDHVPHIRSLPSDATLPIVAACANAVGQLMATIYRENGKGGQSLTLAQCLQATGTAEERFLELLRALPWELLRYLTLELP